MPMNGAGYPIGRSCLRRGTLRCLDAHQSTKPRFANVDRARRSQAEGIGIGHAFYVGSSKGCDRARLVEPDVFVELTRQNSLKIMARKLSLWPIDHADCAFKSRPFQCL